MWLRKHKTLAMAVGVGGVAFALVLGAAWPIYQNTRLLLTKIKVKSNELESLTAKVAILSKLDANVLSERVKVLDSALPPRKDILLYLTSIDGLSRELGLTFGGLSLTPGDLTEASGSAKKTTKMAGLQSLETEIKMRGGQESVYTFLRSIEEVLPLMQIKDIKVSVLGEDQYALALTLGMLWAEPASLDVKGAITLFGEQEERYFTQLSGYRRFEPITSSIPTTQEGKTDLFTPFAVEPIKLEPVVRPQQ